ncbi:hypothetical protein ABXY50_005337 [Escherichia coli]
MSRKTTGGKAAAKATKNATSGPEVEKTESLDQRDGEKIEAVVGASGDTPEPVADPAEKLSADIAKHVSYWAANIKAITLPRRLFSSRRLFKDGIEIKGFKADLKMVYAFLLMLHDTAKVYADKKGQKEDAFTLAVPVGVIRDNFGLTEATTQRYLAMLGNGEGKKTGENFFGLVEWKQGCKGFHIVNIHDLRFDDVAGFELK